MKTGLSFPNHLKCQLKNPDATANDRKIARKALRNFAGKTVVRSAAAGVQIYVSAFGKIGGAIGGIVGGALGGIYGAGCNLSDKAHKRVTQRSIKQYAATGARRGYLAGDFTGRVTGIGLTVATPPLAALLAATTLGGLVSGTVQTAVGATSVYCQARDNKGQSDAADVTTELLDKLHADINALPDHLWKVEKQVLKKNRVKSTKHSHQKQKQKQKKTHSIVNDSFMQPTT